MPPAKLILRAFAFLLDVILVTAAASVIVWKIVLPQSHPGAMNELMIWSQNSSTGGVLRKESLHLKRAMD